MNELALFAGAGGGILGGCLLGWHTVCAVEIEKYPRNVLLQRQKDGLLPRFPIWDDIKTFDGKEWKGKIDIISGGFPCQDISQAGKGKGLAGERSGLWFEFARVIKEVEPTEVFIENSPMLRTRGLETILENLAQMGYNAAWCIVGACNVGAPHRRNRIWILAHRQGFAPCTNTYIQRPYRETTNEAGQGGEIQSRDEQGSNVRQMGEDVADTPSERLEKQGLLPRYDSRKYEIRNREDSCRRDWWEVEPDVGRVANGVASRVDRLKAIGNGQVPAVVQFVYPFLKERLYCDPRED